MSNYEPHQELEAALERLDERLITAADDAELRFQRANTLSALGRAVEARAAYLELIAAAPAHFGALNNLGTLLYESGFQTLARTAYAEAIKNHPENATGHINLANALLTGGDADGARRHYAEALRLKPENPEAHQGVSCLYAEIGADAHAQRHRSLG